MINVKNIRDMLGEKLKNQSFTSVDRESTMMQLTGGSTIELIGESFIVDEYTLFGETNWDYVHREEEWYDSQSLNVNDIPGGAPEIWKAVADKDGFINSNYGYLVYSDKNEGQYERVIDELQQNPASRRAIIIYTRPSIWREFNENGRSDFICTNTVQYLIRNNKLHAIVNMRSNDAIFGFRNDVQWNVTVQIRMAARLGIPTGSIIWQTGSLHVYARHFYLVDHFNKTGELTITKAKYNELYPDSPYKG